MRISRKISLLVLLCITSVLLKAQSPSGLPLPNNPFGYYNIGWYQADSGNILANRAPTFATKFPFTVVGYLNPGVDTGIWWSTGPSGTWYEIPKIGGGGGGGGITQLTGDGTTPTGGGIQPFTLATVNTTTGAFGSASSVADFTVNGKGLITLAGSVPIQISESQVTNLVSDLASKQGTITLGSTTQYFRGDLSLATFPTNLSAFTNGPGYITTIAGITAGGSLTGTYPNPGLAATVTGGAGGCSNCVLTYNAAGQILTASNGSSGGAQNLTYTQLALNNTLSISGGNTQTFLVATHALAGLMDSASKSVVDSLRLRTYAWPVTNLYAVQLLSPAGLDSIKRGGILGTAFQNDSDYFGNNSWFIYNLNASFSTLVAGDSVMVHGSNGQVKYLPSSAIGGGGGGLTSFTSPNSTITIGGTLTAPTVDINLAHANTWSALQTLTGGLAMTSNITFTATNTYSIGTLSDEASQVYTANVSANGGLALSAGSTNNITFAFNGTSEAILSHTGQWNWSGYIGNTFPGTTADSLLTINNGAVREVPATTFTYTGYGSDSVQQVTSGSTATQTTGYNIVVINPASTLSSMTLTTATAFHSSNDLYILFGGTITSGNAVVTSLTINAGSGLTLVQAVNPNGLTYNAGEMIRYHKIGSLLYRYN
jgi:hypothetical protein